MLRSVRASVHPRVALAVALAGALAAATTLEAREPRGDGEDPHAPWAPGPWTGHAPTPPFGDAECAKCHVDIAAEWRSSLHARSFSDDYVARAIAVEPTPFCRGCHAPEEDPSGPARPSTTGVGCVVCHVDEEAIVGATSRPASDGAHAVQARQVLTGNGACDRCHEFPFPGETALMQRTHTELAGSAYAASTCASCHASKIGEGAARHTDHRFAVQGDPERMRRAIRATSRIREGAVLTVTLEAVGVGHAFPTGDLNRSLELRAEVVDAEGRAVTEPVSARLGRSFENRPTGRVEIGDTRVPASGAPDPARRVSVTLPRAPRATERVRWVLAWQRMNADVAASLGMDLRANEVELLAGVLE